MLLTTRALISSLPHRHLRPGDFLLGFFTSCYLGVMKPNPAIYRLGVQLAHAKAAGSVMIDDRIQNVEAAHRTGMQAVHFVSAQQLEEELAKLGVTA